MANISPLAIRDKLRVVHRTQLVRFYLKPEAAAAAANISQLFGSAFL
jgi:hypothetical protein